MSAGRVQPSPYAREVARAVARAGFPVIPMLTVTDEKVPCVRWKSDASSVCRSEDDVVNKWPPRWPRWAAICGVPRELDGRALINLDADSSAAAQVARSLLPEHTRIRTGRSGGEHTWMSLPRNIWSSGDNPRLLHRFYLAGELDWRGGDCIALLPGSLWAPKSHPEVTYTHISGPALPEVMEVPDALAAVALKQAPFSERGRPATGLSARAATSGLGEPDLTAATSGRTVRRVSARSGEAYVQCPGARHPDQNRNRPALHVSARGNGIGLYCFARGCTTDEILNRLGLARSARYDDYSGLQIEIIYGDVQEP